MTPVSPGTYRFRKESIVDIRSRLRLSQTKFASELGVPKNTVSRWETGATTPNADALAKIYSVAREGGVMPKFFAPEYTIVRIRDRALVYWDLNSMNPFYWLPDASKWDDFIEEEVYKRIQKPIYQQFKVFSNSSNNPALDILEELNWDVWDSDSDLVHHAQSESGQDPDGSAVFLITTNPDHVELLKRLKDDGVLVYLMAPSSVEESMIRAVGKKRWINLDGLPGLVNVIRTISPFGF